MADSLLSRSFQAVQDRIMLLRTCAEPGSSREVITERRQEIAVINQFGNKRKAWNINSQSRTQGRELYLRNITYQALGLVNYLYFVLGDGFCNLIVLRVCYIYTKTSLPKVCFERFTLISLQLSIKLFLDMKECFVFSLSR